MTGTFTSRYEAAWTAAYRLLTAASWPAPPVASPGVKVFATGFGQQGPGLESVLIVTETLDDDQDFAVATGQARQDEVLVFPIEVATMLKFRDQWQAMARLVALTGVVEREIHRTTKAGFKPAEFFDQLGNCSLVTWQVSRVSAQIVVTSDGGFAGSAVMNVTVKARTRPT